MDTRRGYGDAERGSFLIEAALAAFITTGVALFTGQMLTRLHVAKKEYAAAQYLERVSLAASDYAKSRESALDLTHTDGDTERIDFITLKNKGFLPKGFPDADAFGSRPRIVLTIRPETSARASMVLRVAVFMEAGRALLRAEAGRIIARVSKARVGYLESGRARFIHGGTLEADALRALSGGPTPLAERLMTLKEYPYRRVVSAGDGTPGETLNVRIPRMELATALQNALAAKAQEYENEMARLLRDFNFETANRELQPADVTEEDSLIIPKHTCPEEGPTTTRPYPLKFTPKISVYSSADADTNYPLSPGCGQGAPSADGSSVKYEGVPPCHNWSEEDYTIVRQCVPSRGAPYKGLKFVLRPPLN